MKEIIAYEMSFDKMFEYSNDVSCIPFQEQYWDGRKCGHSRSV